MINIAVKSRARTTKKTVPLSPDSSPRGDLGLGTRLLHRLLTFKPRPLPLLMSPWSLTSLPMQPMMLLVILTMPTVLPDALYHFPCLLQVLKPYPFSLPEVTSPNASLWRRYWLNTPTSTPRSITSLLDVTSPNASHYWPQTTPTSTPGSIVSLLDVMSPNASHYWHQTTPTSGSMRHFQTWRHLMQVSTDLKPRPFHSWKHYVTLPGYDMTKCKPPDLKPCPFSLWKWHNASHYWHPISFPDACHLMQASS